MLNNLREAINYAFYKNKINKETFDKLIALDPTASIGYKYAPWIVRVYIKDFLPIENKKNDYIAAEKNLRKNLNNYLSQELSSTSSQGYEYKNAEDAHEYSRKEYYKFTKSQEYQKLLRFWQEDKSKVTSDLKIYNSLKNKKMLKNERQNNIMNFPDFNSLWEVINSLSPEDIEAINPIGKDEYDKWYEDKEWLVVIPKTYKAACKFGANTKWCTASKDTDSEFNTYSSEDTPLIDIINKIDNKKWQVHFDTNQWMDAKDDPIEDRSSWINKVLPFEVKQAIYNKTRVLAFSNDKTEAVKEIYYNTKRFDKLRSNMFGEGLVSNIDKRTTAYLSDIINIKLLEYAFESLFDDDINHNAYSYGYENPWEFLDSEPEDPNNLINDDTKDEYDWEKNISLWSSNQREEAGIISEGKVKDEYVREEFRDFDRNYTNHKKKVDKVFEYILRELFPIPDYKDEVIETIINLSTIFPDDMIV